MLSPPAQRVFLPILPADVLTCIFMRCTLRDLLNLSLVYRLLKDPLESNAYLLRYKVLLAVHGPVDVPSPHEDKLSLLMKYHSRVVDGVYTNTGSRYISCVEPFIYRGQAPTGPDTDRCRLSLAFGGTISYTILKPLDGVIDIYEPSPLPGNHTDLLLVATGEPYGETDWDIIVHVRFLKRPDAPHPRVL
ncbi:hypothetical protein L227DRAFT_154543 [Lentinus tigrinus ALCF2SS1-6]|uniref:F-box domain-containing protein n=1 Tax=Lentinus tigrinus ALCF2SS1-6 TaxID=1328759 RepID=A0A5C2S8S6_9APHY|nr:hypothetical protein L227DRAFT_154543 [Lentinus tigrinus ALCF2SS1-6]